MVFELSEAGIKVTADKPFRIRAEFGTDGGHLPNVDYADGGLLALDYHGTKYTVRLTNGRMVGMTTIDSSACTVELRFDRK